MADSNEILEQASTALNQINFPYFEAGLIDLGLVRESTLKGNKLTVSMLVPVFNPDIESDLRQQIEEVLTQIDGLSNVEIKIDVEIEHDGRTRDGASAQVRNVIAVASGKGGVGKSTVAVNLAVALAQSGARVGLVDTDVYGPNVPRMMGVLQLPQAPSADGKIVPAEAFGVKLMSIGFLVKPEQAMVWRGPMLHNAIRQFIQDVQWGELDYLIVDMPPGTGDVQLSLAQTTPISGGVIVTLPQDVSVDDARRGMEMFRQMKIPVFGIVENMSYLDIDGKRIEVFGSGGGQALAEEMGVDLIGQVPMDSAVREGGDSGNPVVAKVPDSVSAREMEKVSATLALRTAVAARESQQQSIPITMVEE
jgi:ATP-binding protein involved in chromosome partitioning